MEKQLHSFGWTQRTVLPLAAFCLATVAAHAQQANTYFSTGFDGTEITNGTVNNAATYSTATTSTNTQPLAGQLNWTSNDSANGVVSTTNTSQVNGGSTYVGTNPSFAGNSGAIGGIFRTTSGALPSNPDVVPSVPVVTLNHPVILTPAAAQYVLDLDFVVSAPSGLTTATARDTFAFTLGNTSGASLLSINFASDGVNTGTLQDNVSTTVNGITTASGQGVVLNGSYHLRLTVTTGASPTFLAVISSSTNSVNISGSLSTSTLAPSAVNQFGTTWTLANTAVTNGGYTGAGDNSLSFDNISFAVPEPSTYALLTLGLVGLGGMLRLRRQQA